MTDRALQQLGIKKITEDDPEYWGLCNILDDDMVEIALKMPDKRVPVTLEEMVEKTGWESLHLKQRCRK